MPTIPFQNLPASPPSNALVKNPTSAANAGMPTISQQQFEQGTADLAASWGGGQPQQPQQQQPAVTPYTLIQNDYNLVGQTVTTMFQQLSDMGLEPQKLQEASRQLQEQWTNAHAEYQSKTMQLQATQDLINRGILDQEAGALAMWRQVLPKEAGDALFAQWKEAQATKAGRELSVENVLPRVTTKGEIQASKLDTYLLEYIKPAEESVGRYEATKPYRPTSAAGIAAGTILPVGLYRSIKAAQAFISPGTRITRDSDTLRRQYIAARTEFGYDGYSNEAKEQFDHTWDRLLKSQGVEEGVWNRNSPEIKALRSRGPLSKAYTRDLADTGGPLAADLRDALSATKKTGTPKTVVLSIDRPDDVKIIQAILEEAGGDVKLAETIAIQRGYSW